MKNKKKYNLYILSNEWKIKREEVYLHRGRVCQKCGSEKDLQIHHGTYTRVYKEKITDLFVLCRYCHVDLHEKCGMRDLLRNTKAFIKGEEIKQKKKRVRMPLEERRKNREIRKSIEVPMAIQDIKNGVKFSQSKVQSIRNWKSAIEILKLQT